MQHRRQALPFCFDTAVVAVIQIVEQCLVEVFYDLKCLQFQQFTFEQAKEIFIHCIVQTVDFATQALPGVLLPERPLQMVGERRTKQLSAGKKHIL